MIADYFSIIARAIIEYFTGSSLDGNWLYSCGGEGIILAHAMNNLENKAKDINALIKKTNSIQVRLDY